ncbi:hypothetical protein M0R45_006875 [Rubus argutus]|uniref:START domain-containing protein n=1 Tax=Rubus argutus TaxID=59490 RepID=A0AAW1YS77_RUBAR
MSAEFVLPTPKVPAREAQFVRYSHQQLDGSWIIVDVSVDEWRQFQRPSTRSICRKRPSGCLIRDLQNGSSFITWVENVDVRDKTEALHPKLTPFVESGYAFGARRWISNLQTFATPHTTTGRHQTKPERRAWRSRPTSEGVILAKPPGLHRTAGCTIELLSSHNRVFDYLRDIQNRPQWERISTNSIVQELATFNTGPDPRNCISVLGISRHNDLLLLQECSTDETGSFVIFAPIEKADFQSLLCGVDQEIQLMPFGFYILPNVSGSILDGTLLTMVFQITVKNVSKKKAVEVATQIVKETLHKIIEAVN